MKFKKILVTGFDKSALDENVWSRIGKLAGKIVFEPTSDVDCLFSKFNKIDKKTIDSLPNLKYIGLLATGYATVDCEYAKSKNIIVTNIPGYATESVAEFVFALILETLRNLEKAKQTGRRGDFSGDGFTASEIKGKTFGIIGMGRIGTRVAEIALGFGAKVLYWSRKRKKDIEKKGAKYQSIDILIRKSDFLSLHPNRNKETEKIMNEKRINAIKPWAVFVNVSPMELIDLNALEKRLEKGNITFIFDHPDEMDKRDVKRLAKYKNCIVYPPIGFVSKEARILKQDIFVSNLENFLKGKSPNKVN
ncbi:2-hydroxyacid dehydrogenase [Patescibacteria group bacterium]|nr:2-hydroxyacid dehydrogenase [Patescibacteria group bacterium]